MITIGVVRRPRRAAVTPWGAIVPDDRSEPLDWYVLAEDRWHLPSQEPTVRQRRIDGTPVVETRLRIPGGDAIQRIFSVADHGGMTVVEVENGSPRAIAVAFDRGDLLTERPIGATPIAGLDLPAGSFVVPIGHGTTIRVAWPHHQPGPGRLPPDLPGHSHVVGGWIRMAERGSRFSIPATGHQDEVVAQRCELMLGTIPDSDPVAVVLAVEELAALGDVDERWVPEVAACVERMASERTASERSWAVEAALAAAERFMLRSGERRAAGDVRRLADRWRTVPRGSDPGAPPTSVMMPSEPPDGVELIAWLERMLVRRGALFPDGLTERWLGVDFEVDRIPLGLGLDTISFAVRWHGDRPAILWEQTADHRLTAPLAAPGWSSEERRGETLWPAPV